jgi:putative transposase
VYEEAGRGTLFTLRADRGRPFDGNTPLCDATIRLLREMPAHYGCWLGAYCLMPDHLHFVVAPEVEGHSVLLFVDRFKRKSTNTSWTHGWSRSLWQPRSHDHLIRRCEAVEEIYRYIYENPVRAGLVEKPEDWPWSAILDPKYATK